MSTCPTCGHVTRPAARRARAVVFLSPDQIAALSDADLFAYRKRTALHDDLVFWLRYAAPRPDIAQAADALRAELETRAATVEDAADASRRRFVAERAAAEVA